MTKPLSSNHFRNLTPYNPPAIVHSIEVKVLINKQNWVLEFQLTGELEKLILPSLKHKKKRQDELWKSTCFEAFMALENNSYLEFNFSPTGNWNCYHFSNYREDMRQFFGVELLDFVVLNTTHENPSRYHCQINLKPNEDLKPTKIGITSVIETLDGKTNYWALRHSGEKADFHRSQDWLIPFDATSDTL